MNVENNSFLVNNSIRWLHLWTEMCWFVVHNVLFHQIKHQTRHTDGGAFRAATAAAKQNALVSRNKKLDKTNGISRWMKKSVAMVMNGIFSSMGLLCFFRCFFLFRVLYRIIWCLHMWLSKADFIQIHNVFWIDDTLGDIIVSWFAADAAFSEFFQRILLIVAIFIQRRCI